MYIFLIPVKEYVCDYFFLNQTPWLIIHVYFHFRYVHRMFQPMIYWQIEKELGEYSWLAFIMLLKIGKIYNTTKLIEHVFVSLKFHIQKLMRKTKVYLVSKLRPNKFQSVVQDTVSSLILQASDQSFMRQSCLSDLTETGHQVLLLVTPAISVLGIGKIL